MAGPQSFDSLFDKLRTSGGAADPSRPSSNPQFGQPSPPISQRSSYGTAPQNYGGLDFHARQNSNESLLQTLESAISSHGSGRYYHPPSFSPQPQFGSIDSQTMQPGSYSPTTQLNRQLGTEHGRIPNSDNPMAPQNYLLGLLNKQAGGNTGLVRSNSHGNSHGRRSVDSIPQMPQRFEALREGARSTTFGESTSSIVVPQRQSLPQDKPINELVSSLLANPPLQQETAAPAGPGVADPRSIMSPPPRDTANTAAAALLHDILARNKPVKDDLGLIAHENLAENQEVSVATPTSPRFAVNSASIPVPDTADSALDRSINEQPTTSKQPLFTHVDPFELLSKTNPRNRGSPHSHTGLLNGQNSAPLAGLATPSNIPLPFSPPPPMPIDEAPEPPLQRRPSPLPVAETEPKVEHHTPPPTQPYVEDVTDPFGQETDPFEGDADPFDSQGTPPSDSSAPVIVEAQLDGVEAPIAQVEPEVVEETAPVTTEVIERETVIQEEVVETLAEAPSQVFSPETAPVPTANGIEKPNLVVYKFPMKPFSQITFNAEPVVTFPSSRFNDIARISRNADQMDRNLISASPAYIVYPSGKSKGGVRIIRQEDGHDVVLMKDSSEKTVNVALGRENQVLAVGVNGTVLWCELDGLEGPMEEQEIENRSFLFPPSALQDQNGGLTKSRTHLSLSHPKVFAIGRGKLISLIHADVARQYVEQIGGISRVNDAAYHTNHSRTIDTQKVSKEFSFSEDDTTVVTIDKAGKIKFWDVSKLIDFEPSEDGTGYPTESPRILTEPVLTCSAVSPGEMYKATSVIFVDKQQPYERRQALRYLVIGLQQNYVIQLWDIAIGRPVQELRFPVSTGSDGLCSICYHSKSGVIVVGNPSRNTISFIHLSTPKYNLGQFTQASFVKAISEKSPNLPKLDATAIMSSLAEYSLGDRGQLISLDLLDAGPSVDDDGKSPLFELYICHTKGLTCLSLTKEDIGFEGNMRVTKGLDAVNSGACTMTGLSPPTTAPQPEATKAEEPKPVPTVAAEPPKAAVSVPQQPQQQPQQKPKSVEVQDEVVAEKPEEKPAVNGQGRKSASVSGLGRGKKPRREVNTVSFAGPVTTAEADEPPPTPQPKKNKGKDREEKKVALSTVSVSPELLEREMKKIEDTVTASFNQALSKEIGGLYQRFDDDRRVQQAASDAKQEAVLRLVSSTLTNGMEVTLNKIMLANITNKLIPELKTSLVENVASVLPNHVFQHINTSLPRAVDQTLNSRAVLGTLAESVVVPIQQDLEALIPAHIQKYVELLNTDVTKQINKLTKEAAKEARRVHEEDTLKVAQLTATVADLTKTIATMEQTMARMTEIQEQLLINSEKLATVAMGSSGDRSVPATPMTGKSDIDLKGDEIDHAIRSGAFEHAMLTWLQSKELQDYYFDTVVVKYNPHEIVPKVSQVVVLTIAASVTGNFESFVEERLSWLEACLNDLHMIREENTEGMLPRICSVLQGRLQNYYMAEENPMGNLHKRVRYLNSVTKELGKVPGYA